MADALTVQLGERSYPITFGSDLARSIREQISGLVRTGKKVVVLTDQTVARMQGAAIEMLAAGAPILRVDAGEETKSLGALGQVLDFLAENQVDRTGALVAIGGGVIGDLGGFAAACYLRGIDFYQVPTTLLAMVDSSVGGKTGINLRAGKNLVGAFHQPRAVFIDTDFLKTLPAREFAAGMAEVIKNGLLGDADLFGRIERAPLTVKSVELAEVIQRCCALKARIVEADERELAREGGRALLNLGHTFAHAIEQTAGYGAYLHGEAVAIGLCAAARLSEKLGLIADTEVGRVRAVAAAHALPTRLNAPLALPTLMAAVARDKKVRAGLPRFVVLEKIGAAATRHEGITGSMVEACFREAGAVDSL
ncbi:MAG: aroB [Verrucomicrobia bacterium]|nr:aroB [Verrucomicrobiota bacterium]